MSVWPSASSLASGAVVAALAIIADGVERVEIVTRATTPPAVAGVR